MPDENDSGVAAPPKRSIATGGRLRSAPGRSRLLPRRLYERLGEFLFQQGEIALYAAGAADEHMVRALDAQCWQKRAGQRAKTALHAVADNRPADLLGDGDAKTNGRVAIIEGTNKQHETRSEEHTSELQPLMRIPYA